MAAILLGRPYLYALRRLGLGQHIRAEGPQSHQKKAGTPTMGGVIIISAVSIALAAMGAIKGPVAWAYLSMLGYGLLGLVDDLLSVTKGRNMGLKARQKLLGQILLAVIIGLYAYRADLGSGIPLPFLPNTFSLGPVLLVGLAVMAMVSTANGVNLTDGLDGLAAGVTAVAMCGQAYLCARFGQPELAVFCAAVAGGCLGFLWLNAHPASVFMGDTGSLALGGALGAAAVLSRTVIFLPLLGGVFVLETLAVILQVISFQTTGRRIFRMSPLHHHFELGGWHETKVVVRFCLGGLLFGLVAVLAAGF